MSNSKGRQAVIWVYGLNISAEPPHSSQKYATLFQLIKNEKIIGAFGNERLEINYFNIDIDTIYGAFVRYTYIDQNVPWWDSEAGKELIDEEGNPIPQVQSGKGPNKKDVFFAFSLEHHKLLIDSKNISIFQLQRAIATMLSNEKIVNSLGRINVTVIPAQDAIEKVLSIHRVNKISYKLTIPNPDIMGTHSLETDCYNSRALKNLLRRIHIVSLS